MKQIDLFVVCTIVKCYGRMDITDNVLFYNKYWVPDATLLSLSVCLWHPYALGCVNMGRICRLKVSYLRMWRNGLFFRIFRVFVSNIVTKNSNCTHWGRHPVSPSNLNIRCILSVWKRPCLCFLLLLVLRKHDNELLPHKSAQHFVYKITRTSPPRVDWSGQYGISSARPFVRPYSCPKALTLLVPLYIEG